MTAGGLAQFAEDDGQVAGGQGQGLPVDLGADTGEEVVTEAGDTASDHHQTGVEEGDESGDDLPDPVSALTDEGERGGVPGGGRRRDVDGGEPSGRREPVGELLRSAAARRVLGVAGQGGAAEVGLQAAVVAAGAGAAVGFDLDVSDVARAARRTAVDLSADDDAAADAGADLDAEEVADRTGDSRRAAPPWP